MPFTPFHVGPGLLVKALLQGSFSLLVFAWAQIVMDIQPLVVLMTGEGHLHGFSHTFVGATLIGLGSALTGKYAAEFGLRRMGQFRYLPISWPVAGSSALIGSYSHVLLDGVMHADVQPLSPFLLDNHLFGFVSVTELHKFCLYSGILGIGLYFAISRWLRSRNRDG
ncbi:hypothetical protein [Accumulibacter sp.]|uniref:hypothetical protein n=1 Tax=Accumulibacter sp. TaxID=2053492 RepID=UPI00262BEB0D|nr:hypothetical protein [Accumulibacter sp.]